jgi:hypothetical protein
MPSGDYADDLSILNIAVLWRRVPPRHFFFDDNLGRMRPSKAAFYDHPDGSPMSVVLADDVLESGRQPVDILVDHEGFALAAITAGLAREKKQGVARDPLPEEPAHAIVFGKKTSSATRAFAKACQWVIAPVPRSAP